MPNRTTRASLRKPPNRELTWIRPSLTALAQWLLAVTDTSARSQEGTRYFRSRRTAVQHRTDRARTGNIIPCNVETQRAGTLGFWPSSHSKKRVSAAVMQTQLRREWRDELRTLPACHNRVSIAVQSLLLIPRLALTRSLSARNSKRSAALLLGDI